MASGYDLRILKVASMLAYIAIWFSLCNDISQVTFHLEGNTCGHEEEDEALKGCWEDTFALRDWIQATGSIL